MKQNYACSSCTSLLQTCFSMLFQSVSPCECNILKVRSLPKAIGVLARKNSLVMNWHSFSGQEYCFFNFIICCLIPLKVLKSQKKFAPWNPASALPQILSCNYDSFATTVSLIKLNLLPQNRHWLKYLDKFLTGRTMARGINKKIYKKIKHIQKDMKNSTTSNKITYFISKYKKVRKKLQNSLIYICQ